MIKENGTLNMKFKPNLMKILQMLKLHHKDDEELRQHKRNYITSHQHFCYGETGFTEEKHKLIRDTGKYSSDINYFCYVGCYCTQVKDLLITKRTLNYESLTASVTRNYSTQVANRVINDCKNISTNSLCAAGREVHDCLAKHGVAIEGLIGYFDGDKI
ncbi:uncharacterized protein LOC106644970 [Copidosoma floridanum]|uniref:uncharacterized protein LOC106644970 n=1 Tax=Copidosoma floridanum TaxID=29053 RepID=UPI0006C94214|nr:uncharacterized protein LOC106644970 [Copidosoma floridanum]